MPLSDVNENQEVLYDYVDQLAEIQTNGQSASEQKIPDCDPVYEIQG